MPKKVLPMTISIGAALFVGGLSAFLTKGSMPVYSALNLPALAPPSWVFPIVWTVLFVMMGIAAALVWCSNGEAFDAALLFYAAQLIVNFFQGSILAFREHTVHHLVLAVLYLHPFDEGAYHDAPTASYNLND